MRKPGYPLLLSAALASAAAAQPVPAPADSFSVALELPSHGVTLRGILRVAAGKGPHPTIVSLQGFPGSANSQVPGHMQKAGFNGASIFFRGQRSSDGQYTVEGTVEDAAAMVAFLRSDSARRAFRVDPQRIILIGFSAGTFAALQATAADPGLRCVGAVVPFNWTPGIIAGRSDSAIRAGFEAYFQNLTAGPNPPIRSEGFVARILANAEHYDITKPAANLRDRRVLLVGAAQDLTAPLPIHFDPLLRAVRASGARLRDTLVTDGHNLPNANPDVLAAIVRWLQTDCLR